MLVGRTAACGPTGRQPALLQAHFSRGLKSCSTRGRGSCSPSSHVAGPFNCRDCGGFQKPVSQGLVPFASRLPAWPPWAPVLAVQPQIAWQKTEVCKHDSADTYPEPQLDALMMEQVLHKSQGPHLNLMLRRCLQIWKSYRLLAQAHPRCAVRCYATQVTDTRRDVECKAAQQMLAISLLSSLCYEMLCNADRCMQGCGA
eukprot:scaffold79569_cov21-Tisochrysis_lutea.AAC.1